MKSTIKFHETRIKRARVWAYENRNVISRSKHVTVYNKTASGICIKRKG